MLWLRLFRESLAFAWQAILVNRLRTFLSLLGVMVGIFVISAVFTVVDSLESELRDTFNMLDDDVLFVTKWPWSTGGDYPWWKYVQRRPPTERNLELLSFTPRMGDSFFVRHLFSFAIVLGQTYKPRRLLFSQ